MLLKNLKTNLDYIRAHMADRTVYNVYTLISDLYVDGLLNNPGWRGNLKKGIAESIGLLDADTRRFLTNAFRGSPYGLGDFADAIAKAAASDAKMRLVHEAFVRPSASFRTSSSDDYFPGGDRKTALDKLAHGKPPGTILSPATGPR